MRSVEDHYWWYVGLHSLVAQVARARLAAQAVILDAGCGTGGMLKVLHTTMPQARLSGVDASPEAVELANQRGLCPVQLARIEALPFAAGAFDAVICLDVLYMRGVDERAAVEEFRRVLQPGGPLILNLPAFEFLRGEHDLAVAGERRYTKARVAALLEGFQIETLTYWNATLFPFVALVRALSRFRDAQHAPRSDLKPLPSLVNGALAWLIRAEFAVARRCPLPFGSSVFAVARKAR